MISKKLQRQLKRAYGVTAADQIASGLLGSIAADHPAAVALADFCARFPEFLDAIDRSFAEMEDRLSTASRNIDISSAELSRARDAVTAMVDSLTEGYMVVNADGVCDGVFSRVSTSIFERSPGGLHLFDILKLDGAAREEAEGWLKLAFADRLGTTELFELGPQTFANGAGNKFQLGYGLIRDYRGVAGLVVIASDITGELEAKRLADAHVNEARVITKLVEEKESFQSFVRLAREVLNLDEDLTDARRQQFLFDLHTLKGGAASFYLQDVENCIHHAELELRAEPGADLRQMAARIQAELDRLIERHRQLLGAGDDWVDQFTVKKSALFELVAAGLKQGVPEVFLDQMLAATYGVEVGQWLRSFGSTVEVAAWRLDKNVGLTVSGESVRVPLKPYRRFFAALVHVFRNAVDHGVESTDERLSVGKPARAQIDVRFGGADHRSEGWWISIADDGRGIDVAKLRRKFGAGADVPDAEILNRLFETSISTKDEVSTTSGLGVGIAALGRELRALGATSQIETKLGRGTTLTIRLPAPEHLLHAKRELGLIETAPAPSQLNFQLNDMISEIAVLIGEARERERVDQEILVARAVQKTLLPAEVMSYGNLSVSGRSFAAGSCGGDWWYHARSGDRVVVWIGDVLGHGIASGLVASACRATAGALHLVRPDAPVETDLAVMNDVIYSMTAGDIYVTGTCLKIDLGSGVVRIASASHPAVLLVGDDLGTSRPLKTPASPALGLKSGQLYHGSTFSLEPGSGVFMMTDGLLDLNLQPGTRWSLPRILKLLSEATRDGASAQALTTAVESFVFDRASGRLNDDMTYVALYREPTRMLKAS